MGRKEKKLKRKPVNTCRHEDGYDFVRTNHGVKRTCRKGCGHSVTDVAPGVFGTPQSPGLSGNGYKRKMREANG